MTTTTIPPYPMTLEDRLAELADARAQLMAELDSGATATPSAPSDSDRWTMAETAHHLHLAEAGIAGMLTKALRSGERHARVSDEHLRAEWERIRVLVGTRATRVQAPAPAVPADAPALAETVEHLHQSRQTLLEILSQASLDDLASISMPHPIEGIGNLTGAGWVSLIGYHERRHTEQIREIKAGRG